MRPADGRGRCLAQTQVTHLPLPYQFRHRADGLFNAHLWIDAVQVVEIDGIDPQPLERVVAGPAHVLRPSVETPSPLTVGAAHEAEFRGHPHFVAPAADCLADQLFVGVRSVGVRRVEQIDPEFQSSVDGCQGLRLVGGPVGIAHTHAAESNRRDGQTLLAESSLLHVLLLAKLWGRGFSEQTCALTGRLDAQKEAISRAGGSHADKDKAGQGEVLRDEMDRNSVGRLGLSGFLLTASPDAAHSSYRTAAEKGCHVACSLRASVARNPISRRLPQGPEVLCPTGPHRRACNPVRATALCKWCRSLYLAAPFLRSRQPVCYFLAVCNRAGGAVVVGMPADVFSTTSRPNCRAFRLSALSSFSFIWASYSSWPRRTYVSPCLSAW